MLSPKVLVVLAFAVSAFLTWLTIQTCHRKEWLFHPRAERWSKRSVAKFGGLPIMVTLVLLAQFQPISARVQHVVWLTLALSLVGLWDDLRPMPPLAKLASQVTVAILAVCWGVLYPLPTHSYLASAVTVFWIVGVTNAFNLLDNMDGLSAGVALIASVSLVMLASDNLVHPIVALTFAGALAGFLVFNFSPAQIFMGDAGSLPIGFFLACISLIATERIRETASILIVPVLVVFIPIFDTLLVSITRRINGRAISAGARDHSSHRLVLLGLSERSAVLTLYSIAILGALVAYASRALYPEAGIGVIAVFLFGSGLFWLYLAQLQLPDDWLSRTNVATLAIPAFLNSLAKRARMVFIDAALIVLSLYLSFLLRFDRVTSTLDTFLLLCSASLTIKLVLLALFGAYSRSKSASSQIYTVVKATTLSSLSVVAILTFLNRFENFSRAVFGIDLIMSAALLIATRYSHFMFDHVLARKTRNGRCVIVGGASAVFFQNFFKWRETDKELVGAILTSSKYAPRDLSVPALPFQEIPSFLGAEMVTDVYLLPDCPAEYRSSIVALCLSLGIATYKFDIALHGLEEATDLIPEFSVQATRTVVISKSPTGESHQLV